MLSGVGGVWMALVLAWVRTLVGGWLCECGEACWGLLEGCSAVGWGGCSLSFGDAVVYQ